MFRDFALQASTYLKLVWKKMAHPVVDIRLEHRGWVGFLTGKQLGTCQNNVLWLTGNFTPVHALFTPVHTLPVIIV